MDSIATLTTFLGWCTAINMGMLMLATVLLSAFRSMILRFHSKILGLDEPALALLYAQYLSNYKIAIVMLNLVPYVALKLMS